MIRLLKATVLDNRPLTAPGHWVLTFHAPELARDARPGHFIGVAAENGIQILRRPFSVYTVDTATGAVSILFSVYGPVTHAMARYVAGDTLDLIGPLGGRIFAADTRPGTHHIMVGGGYGVPPLAFLARTILAADPAARVTLINGARQADFLVGADSLAESGVNVRTCTNDGSCGTQGLVTDLLGEFLGDLSPRPASLDSGFLTPRPPSLPVVPPSKEGGEDAATRESIPLVLAASPPSLEGGTTGREGGRGVRNSHIYTCGPAPMMRAVGEMAIHAGVPCQVSMETFMPCGVGICMGCAVKRSDGAYVRGCTEGPVFEAREIVWE